MENFVQLKKDNILRIGIKDADGNDTGEHLEFDLEDIELPFKIQECEFQHKKNLEYLRNRLLTIKKREDKDGKKAMSANEEEQMKTIKEFCRREMIAWDLFLGEGGTNKLLNGRNPYYSMYEDISEMLEPIMPLIEKRGEDIKEKLIQKYKTKEDNILE